MAKDLWQCEELNAERRKPLCHEIKKEGNGGHWGEGRR